MTNPSLALGSTLDKRYEIRHFLAQGGSAEVYVARQRFLERDVVVKVPAGGGTRRVLRERFEREARALSYAQHPNLVQLLDVGEYEDGLYLVLEHMQGRTLGGLLAARGKLAPADVLSLGLSLSSVLGHCHKMGIIHRDVKPDNVFILRGPEQRLKLFDFGIARLEYDRTQHSGKNTQEVAVLGTPEYMAPEALRMHPGIDHRVDIYAFGILLYELLCGSVPFEGTYGDILVKLSTQGAPSLRSANPNLPEALLSAVDRCLAYNPSERFQSMESVSEALTLAARELESAAPHPEAGFRERRSVAETPAARSPVAAAPPPAEAPRPPPPPQRGPDARRHPRAPYTSLASLTLSGVTASGRVEEISAGGVQFIRDSDGHAAGAGANMEVGQRWELKFTLPMSGRLCQVQAQVRWTRAARAGRQVAGLEFFGLPTEAKQVIEEYVTLMRGS